MASPGALAGCFAAGAIVAPAQPLVQLSRGTISRRRTAPRTTSAAWGGKQASVAVPPPPPQELPTPVDAAVPFAVALVVATGAFAWRRLRGGKPLQRRSPQQPQYDAALEGSNPDGREYRMALARTRQAVAVHRAIGFMSTANTARAMVELRRALHENSACRAPLVNVQHEARQLSELYRMHLQNSPVPADFAVLLQLRTLLDLDFDEAERIEQEIMQQGSLYSI